MNDDSLRYDIGHHRKLLDAFYLIGRIRELLFGGRSMILVASATMQPDRAREVRSLYKRA